MIMERLQKVFREVFDDDLLIIKESTTASDIDDWDSLAHIQLVSDIEKEFGIKFNLKEIISVADVGEFAKLIESKL